jgi:hypothetical protein
MSGNLAESREFHTTLGIFYMPQIYDMGQTALLPLRRGSRAEDFFALKNPTVSAGFEPANLGTKGQPLDHRSRCDVGLVAVINL